MTQRLVGIIALASSAGLLAACSSLGNAVGVGKNPPDEFAITTQAPLTLPPDYALRPPRPGETRPQELSTSDRARQLLVGDPGSEPPSNGELVLIQSVGGLDVDPNIRSVLAAENGGRASKSASLANRIVFWNVDANGNIDDGAAPLRVEDEAAWMEERRRSIESVTGGESVTIVKDERGILNLPGVK